MKEELPECFDMISLFVCLFCIKLCLRKLKYTLCFGLIQNLTANKNSSCLNICHLKKNVQTFSFLYP